MAGCACRARSRCCGAPRTAQYDFLDMLYAYVWTPLLIVAAGGIVACVCPRARSTIVGGLLALSYLVFAPVSIRVFQYFNCMAVLGE